MSVYSFSKLHCITYNTLNKTWSPCLPVSSYPAMLSCPSVGEGHTCATSFGNSLLLSYWSSPKPLLDYFPLHLLFPLYLASFSFHLRNSRLQVSPEAGSFIFMSQHVTWQLGHGSTQETRKLNRSLPLHALLEFMTKTSPVLSQAFLDNHLNFLTSYKVSSYFSLLILSVYLFQLSGELQVLLCHHCQQSNSDKIPTQSSSSA